MADVLEDLKDLLHDASSSIQTIVDHGKGNQTQAAKLRQFCEDEGWIAISTKDDWKTIYGPGVELDRDWVWDHPDTAGPNARKVVSDKTT